MTMPSVLLVEDEQDVLTYVSMLLEFHGYEVLKAENGKIALDVLSTLKRLPDIIISDIGMPEMDGYALYNEVRSNYNWNLIPFIFLTAKTSARDIRFGKRLGVDDYITKPFQEADLLATIEGKINRAEKTKQMTDQIQRKLLAYLDIHERSESPIVPLLVFCVVWDERIGPRIEKSYPSDSDLDVENIAIQLFQTAVSLYGPDQFYEPRGVLLSKISNIQQDGYIYFDSRPDSNQRGGKQLMMLCLISKSINYFESLRLKELFATTATHIKKRREWEIKKVYDKASLIMQAGFIPIIR